MKYSITLKALFLYLAVILLFTYPLVTNLTNSIYGISHDNFGGLWDLWAYNKSIHENISLNRFDYIDYPSGINIIPDLKMFLPLAINIVFGTLISNPFVAFNIIVIIKFVLAAFSMFVLLKELKIQILIAWIGGCIYALNPFMNSLTLAYGPNYISVFLPLFIFNIILYNKNKNLPNFILLVLVSLLFFVENYYYTYFTFVVLFISSIFYVLSQKNTYIIFLKKSFIKKLITIFIVIGILCFIAFVIKQIRDYFLVVGNNYSTVDAMRMSVRPLFYFIPTINNTFFGDHFVSLYWSKMKPTMDTFELSVYLGYSVLITSLYAVFKFNSLSKLSRRYFFIFSIFFSVSILLALGPMFPDSWDGMTSEDNLLTKNIGFYFFELAPMFRHQTRFHLVTIFSLIVCFSLSLNILTNLVTLKKRSLIILPIVMVVFVEYSTYSYNNILHVGRSMPQAYHYLKDFKPDFAIAEWPNHWWRILSTYQSFQTIHQKKRYTKVNVDIRLVGVQKQLHNLGINYFIFNRSLPPVTSYPMSPLTNDFGYKNFYAYKYWGMLERVKQWNDSVIYRYDNENKAIFNTTFTTGFDLNSDHNSALKWTNKDKSLLVIESNKSYKDIHFIFTARAIEPKNIEFILNDKIQGDIFVKSETPQFYSILLKNIKEGTNILKILNKDGLSNIQIVLNIPDNRDVGIFIGNFNLSLYRLSLVHGFCRDRLSIQNAPNLCSYNPIIGINNLNKFKNITISFETENDLFISEIKDYKYVINEKRINSSIKLVKINLYDVSTGEHEIPISFSKIVPNYVYKESNMLSNPILFRSLELATVK